MLHNNNIALVGCGAIAQSFYLPALANRRRNFGRVWVVDPIDKARQTACSFVEAEQSATLADIADDLQFIIVASPNMHHFSAAREALSRNAHVLIEKPFVIWPDEGRELIKLAKAHHRLIAVNQTRRLFPYSAELRRRIATGEFGMLKAIVHNEGSKLSWPFSSGAGFARDAQRTGVIMDIGVHVLDFYQYLLQTNWTYKSATHDGFKGPEGLVELRLKANGAPVSIRLSRYLKQENIAHLYFEKVDVHMNIFDNGEFFVKTHSGGRVQRIVVESATIDSAFLADRVLTNFLAASEGREDAICGAESSLPIIEILDEIYRLAKRYPETLGAV
jgi:predicted dehydrogenase